MTDTVMPELSGFDVYDALAARIGGLPVLFMSGFVPEGLERVGENPQAAFIGKPFTLAGLADAVWLMERLPHTPEQHITPRKRPRL